MQYCHEGLLRTSTAIPWKQMRVLPVWTHLDTHQPKVRKMGSPSKLFRSFLFIYPGINCLYHSYSTELRSVLGISWVLLQMFFKQSFTFGNQKLYWIRKGCCVRNPVLKKKIDDHISFNNTSQLFFCCHSAASPCSTWNTVAQIH